MSGHRGIIQQKFLLKSVPNNVFSRKKSCEVVGDKKLHNKYSPIVRGLVFRLKLELLKQI
jgi:hypothetical protein